MLHQQLLWHWQFGIHLQKAIGQFFPDLILLPCPKAPLLAVMAIAAIRRNQMIFCSLPNCGKKQTVSTFLEIFLDRFQNVPREHPRV